MIGESMIRKHRKFAVGVASLVAAASMAVPGIAGAATASTNAPKPDFGYFAGKTLTLIVPAPPSGAVTNALDVDVANFVGSYLHATVNEQYVAVNGTIGGSNEAAAAPPNGLTIGINTIESTLIDLATAPNVFTFNLKKLEWIGATAGSPRVIVSCNPAIKSWSQVVHGKTPLTWLGIADSNQAIQPELFSKAFNFPVTVLNGFASATAQATGCEQHDGDLAVVAFSQLLNAGQTGFIPGLKPLLSMGGVPKISTVYSLFSPIPTIDSYVAEHPLKTKTEQKAFATNAVIQDQTAPNFAFFEPPGTPMKYVLALRDAFAAAYKNPTIKSAVADVPDPNVWIPASEVTTSMYKSLKAYGPFMAKVISSS
jgi:hypothetical protein